jgi:MFS family permease
MYRSSTLRWPGWALTCAPAFPACNGWSMLTRWHLPACLQRGNRDRSADQPDALRHDFCLWPLPAAGAPVLTDLGRVAFLPFSLTLTLSNVINGWLSRAWGARRLMVIGTVLGALGFGLLPGLAATSTYATMLPGLLILPLGVGLAVPAMTASLLGTVPKARSGVASGVLNTVRQSAGAVGVALYGAFLVTAGVPGIRTARLVRGLPGEQYQSYTRRPRRGKAQPERLSTRAKVRAHVFEPTVLRE